MYGKFSKRLETVIKLARKLARGEDQEYLGTEHVLLAIAQEGTGIAAELLSKHGADEYRLKAAIDRLVGNSMTETWIFGNLPGSPHLKNAVAAAVEQAQNLNSKHVCAEHLLLGILKEDGSIAAQALNHLGITYESARADVMDLNSRSQPDR